MSISCSASATLRITSPAWAARSRTSFSSVAVIDSPGFFVIDSAPRSSPWWRTGSRIDDGVSVPSAFSEATRGSGRSASVGHTASARSSSPTRTHTSARDAPVPSASARAILGNSSSFAYAFPSRSENCESTS